MSTLVSRRNLLLGLTALPFAFARRAPAAATEPMPIYRGAAVMPHLLEETAFVERLVADCSCLTPEVDLKWTSIEPARGCRSWTGADRLAAFARASKMRMRGHTLLWHRATPTWAVDRISEGDWTPIKEHFGALMPRYAELIDEWDVINEPIDADHGIGGLRRNTFFAAFGPDYIERALWQARELAPGAALMLNEYGLEVDGAWGDARRGAFLRLAERLKKRGAPLDGIGIQAHLHLASRTTTFTALNRFLRNLDELGLGVTITELDVREHDRSLPIGERDRHVAATVSSFLDVVLPNRNVRGVVTWGLSDRHSWIQHGDENSAGSLEDDARQTERLNRGLPYGASYEAKPMALAVNARLPHKT